MNKAKELLVQLSEKLELPAQIVAGSPRVEVIGARECNVEPQKGLVEYNPDRVKVLTTDGTVVIEGTHLHIHQMNSDRISVRGKIGQISLLGAGYE